RALPPVHDEKSGSRCRLNELLLEYRTIEQPKGRILILGEIRQVNDAELRNEISEGRGGLEHTVDNARLHVLEHLALAAELTGRIEIDLKPAATFILRNLRHAAPADQQRMLRIENAADLEGVDVLRRTGTGCGSEHGERTQSIRSHPHGSILSMISIRA